MGRILCIVLMLILFMPAARAEEEPRVAAHLPALTFTVTDTGKGTGNHLRPNLLSVEIVAEDGSLSQTLTWESNEHPDFERIAPFVRLVDYNFDGFRDLQLLVAQGARNTFYAVALWDEEKGCFREVLRDTEYLPGRDRGSEVVQVSFCNPEFYPDAHNPGFGDVYCVEADGYAYCTERVYSWEARYGLTTSWVASVYDAGDGLIGESLVQWGTGLAYWWDQTYPEKWYYGEGNADNDRIQARRLLMLGRGTVDAYWMTVDNVDWVNLRQMDSKDSPSLAKLNRGTSVQVLDTGCGEDGGWVLVYVHSNDNNDDDREVDGLTGYIWHSYLSPDFMRVANVDWVNVRESADKQSIVVTTLDAGELVDVGENINGWVRVHGWKEVEGFSDTMPYTGYIWHSYLEADEFVPWQ